MKSTYWKIHWLFYTFEFIGFQTCEFKLIFNRMLNNMRSKEIVLAFSNLASWVGASHWTSKFTFLCYWKANTFKVYKIIKIEKLIINKNYNYRWRLEIRMLAWKYAIKLVKLKHTWKYSW